MGMGGTARFCSMMHACVSELDVGDFFEVRIQIEAKFVLGARVLPVSYFSGKIIHYMLDSNISI